MSVSRMPASRPLPLILAIAIAIGLGACNNTAPAPTAKPAQAIAVTAPIDVTRLILGTAIGPDGTIAQPTATFKPADTIHAAVTTERAWHDVALKARWTFQDSSVVNETTKTISPTGTLVTDFQLTNDAGWPIGRYKLEILVNDQLAAVTEYTVNP